MLKFQLKRGWRKTIKQRLLNPSRKTMPVFLVGCGRSGTSMLLHHLGRSWSVDPFNEDHQAAFNNYRLRPLDVIEKLVDRSYARAAVFKPVITTPHSCEYLNRFPNARLIFVYRHYHDVVNSSLNRFGPADRLAHVNSWMADNFGKFAPISPPEQTKTAIRQLWKPTLSPESAAALYWLLHNSLWFDLNLHLNERAMLVSYESLVADAVPKMRAVCDFLNLKFEPEMADDIRSTSVGRDPQPVLDRNIETACEALWQQLQLAYSRPVNTQAIRRKVLYDDNDL